MDGGVSAVLTFAWYPPNIQIYLTKRNSKSKMKKPTPELAVSWQTLFEGQLLATPGSKCSTILNTGIHIPEHPAHHPPRSFVNKTARLF